MTTPHHLPLVARTALLRPGRTFTSLREATAFAIEAAAPWGVASVVWQSRAGLLRRLATYPPQRPQRTPP